MSVGIVASSVRVGSLMSDDTEETEMAKAGLAAAPSLTYTFTSGEGCVASVSAVGAAVAVASSAARRRTCERKEDMCSAVGGAVVIGTGSVPTSMPTSTVKTAVAVAPAAVPPVASREEEAARVVAADVVGTVVSSAVIEGILGKWGVELPPILVSRWGAAAGGGPAPRGDVPVEDRGERTAV